MKGSNFKKINLFIICFLLIFSAFITEKAWAEGFFQQHNTWYQTIPANPQVTTDSSQFLANVAAYDFGNLFAHTDHEYGHPIYFVNKKQAITTVTFGNGGQPVMQAYQQSMRWNHVPIPSNAIPAGNAAACVGEYRDGPLKIISTEDRCSDVAGNYTTKADCETAGGHWGLWEWDFFRATECSEGKWVTQQVRKWDLRSSGIIYPWDNHGGARAIKGGATLGVLTWNDMDNAVNHDIPIRHAIAFTTRGVKDSTPIYSSVYPADSNYSYNYWGYYTLRVGMRIQLIPPDEQGGFNCDTQITNVAERAICHAMQDYGLIFVDNSTSNTISFEDLNYNPYGDNRSWTSVGMAAAAPNHSDLLSELNLKGLISHMRIIDPLVPKTICVGNPPKYNNKPCIPFTMPQFGASAPTPPTIIE